MRKFFFPSLLALLVLGLAMAATEVEVTVVGDRGNITNPSEITLKGLVDVPIAVKAEGAKKVEFVIDPYPETGNEQDKGLVLWDTKAPFCATILPVWFVKGKGGVLTVRVDGNDVRVIKIVRPAAPAK